MIRWVTTSTDDVVDERVNLVTDATDVPTAQLASLIAPCLVLSQDKSLRRPGFAPEEWRSAAGYGAVVIEAAQQQQGVVVAMGLPVAGVVGGAVKLGGAIRLPWWASLALLAGGGYLLLRSPHRRRAIGEKAWPFLEAVSEMMDQASQREEAGARLLKEVMLEPAAPPTIKQQVATVLARATEPQLAQEVLDEMTEHFGEFPTPSVTQVRTVLRDGVEFTQVERYRWQLGRFAGPWRPIQATSR